MNGESMAAYLEQLHAFKANQLKHYTSFREFAAILVRKGIVTYDAKTHRYTRVYGAGLSAKEWKVTDKLMQLQRNIEQQNALILELEHAIQQEEKKQQTNTDTERKPTNDGDNPQQIRSQQ